MGETGGGGQAGQLRGGGGDKTKRTVWGGNEWGRTCGWCR